ncbi:hypothetical protein [Streptomyces sp. WAC08241]|uniref:hypothetical protein n=1 Tax=Streptomyces sp. WAC08241 TaxID=2487421 RepID=UPI000F78EB0D|nr:hypothetical protein [Streptomyces sp. WAC08241]RSS41632.1 hypothetical protein EF906_13985 [Streptomyces sp. WAC08241]
MSGLTLADLSVPLSALRLLAVDFPHLPAPWVDVATVYPERLSLSFHDDFAAFEAWREALNIAPESVVHRVQRDGRTQVLKALMVFAGAELELTGYTSVPDPERVLAGSGAAA